MALGGLGIATWLGEGFMFHLFKPLPVLSLALFYFFNRRKALLWEDTIMSLAIFFAFLGDSFLMYEGNTWFMLGLGSFLLTHIGYSIVLFRQGGDYLSKRWLVWLLLLGYGALLVWVMGKGMARSGETGPAYSCDDLCSGHHPDGPYRHQSPSCRARQQLSVGAGRSHALPFCQTRILGVNKFAYAIPASEFLILLSYYAAQYFIVFGYLGALNFEKRA
ncbi:MAG: lysoplasmalogenase family protein [Bacteroidia bacterium]